VNGREGLRLLRTNVLANSDLLELLGVRAPRRYFSASCDKAVNSASLMGASKAFMERIYLAQQSFSSARFANIAFSGGSLLQSSYQRIEQGQPLVAPSDVRRYLISHVDARQLCLIACLLGANRELFVSSQLRTSRHFAKSPK